MGMGQDQRIELRQINADSEQTLAGTARGIHQNSSLLFDDSKSDVGIIRRLNGTGCTEKNEFHGCLTAETARAIPANAIGFVKNSTALPPAGFTASRIPVHAAAQSPPRNSGRIIPAEPEADRDLYKF